MADTNSTPPRPAPRTRTRKAKPEQATPESNAGTIKGKSATIHDFQFIRACSTLKKTPVRWHPKCLELLHEQAALEERLRNVRILLDTLMNAPLTGR